VVCSPALFLLLILATNRTKPRLLYHTADELLSVQDPDHYSVSRAYLPVELAHSTEVRSTQTNEPVSPWPALDYAAASLKFEQAKQSFAGSEPLAAQLQSALASVPIPAGINKIIALGCSTITWADDDPTMPSIAQHILALTVRDVLVTSHGPGSQEIKCYAQDPIYTPVDEQVLCREGFVVVDDPRAFLEVDEASVVISLAPDIPVRQIIADLTRPAILLWDNVANSGTNQFWQVTLNSSTLYYTISLSIRIHLIPPLAPTLPRHV
jgi:hypothetical protein